MWLCGGVGRGRSNSSSSTTTRQRTFHMCPQPAAPGGRPARPDGRVLAWRLGRQQGRRESVNPGMLESGMQECRNAGMREFGSAVNRATRSPGIRESKNPGMQESGNPGHPGTQESGNRNPGIREPKNSGIRKSGDRGLWEIWESGNSGIRGSANPGTLPWMTFISLNRNAFSHWCRTRTGDNEFL